MLVFLKLGGSLITDKRREGAARLDVIRRLAEEVRAARGIDPHLQLVLGHGSGSFGHAAAQRTRFLERQAFDAAAYAEVAAAAARLNRIVADIFVEVGVPVVTLPPSALARCAAGRLESLALWPVQQLLAGRAIPLVYGDVALDTVYGATILSTENVFAYLARHLHPARILLAGDVDGVYTADPTRLPDAHPIPEITPASYPAVARALGGAAGFDVTGGMLAKVRTMVGLVEELPELEVYVISGRLPGRVQQALLGAPEGGTAIRKGA